MSQRLIPSVLCRPVWKVIKIILTLIIGFEVVRLENVVSMIDVFVTATGNKNIIMAEHMA